MSDSHYALKSLYNSIWIMGYCVERDIVDQEQKKCFEQVFANIHQIIAEKKTLGKEKVVVSPDLISWLQNMCYTRTVTWRHIELILRITEWLAWLRFG